jgi:hypothetical protein
MQIRNFVDNAHKKLFSGAKEVVINRSQLLSYAKGKDSTSKSNVMNFKRTGYEVHLQISFPVDKLWKRERGGLYIWFE